MSAATTIADAIGDLAALHQHVVESGWVVGLVFCHSEVLLITGKRSSCAFANAGVQIKTHGV